MVFIKENQSSFSLKREVFLAKKLETATFQNLNTALILTTFFFSVI